MSIAKSDADASLTLADKICHDLREMDILLEVLLDTFLVRGSISIENEAFI